MMNTILGVYICTELESNDWHFQHTIFNVIHTISKTIISKNKMNEFELHKKICWRKNIGGAVVQKRNDEYGYFPFSPDEFFVIFRKMLYGLGKDQDNIQKLDNWYNCLIHNHCKGNDCESYMQI